MAASRTIVITSNHVYTDVAHPDRPLAVAIEDGRVRELLPRGQARELAVEGADVCDYGDAFVCPEIGRAHV